MRNHNQDDGRGNVTAIPITLILIPIPFQLWATFLFPFPQESHVSPLIPTPVRSSSPYGDVSAVIKRCGPRESASASGVSYTSASAIRPSWHVCRYTSAWRWRARRGSGASFLEGPIMRCPNELRQGRSTASLVVFRPAGKFNTATCR